MAIKRVKKKQKKAAKAAPKKVKVKAAATKSSAATVKSGSFKVGSTAVITAACKRGTLAAAGFRQGQKVRIKEARYGEVQNRRVKARARLSPSTSKKGSKNRQVLVQSLGGKRQTVWTYVHALSVYPVSARS